MVLGAINLTYELTTAMVPHDFNRKMKRKILGRFELWSY
jgi:hypothetical protein